MSNRTTQDVTANQIESEKDNGRFYTCESIPLKIYKDKTTGNFFVYVKLIEESYTFKENSKGERSRYGWLTVAGEGSTFKVPHPEDLWMHYGTMQIRKADSLVITSDKKVALNVHNVIQSIQIGKDKSKSKETRQSETIARVYQSWVAAIKAMPEEERYSPIPLPREPHRTLYFQAKTQTIPTRQRTAQEEAKLLWQSTKDVGNTKARWDAANDEIDQRGMSYQNGNSVTFRDRKGKEISSATPIISTGSFKSMEFKNVKPVNVIYSKFKQNALGVQFPSSTIMPIRQWVEAIGDTEEYLMGIVVALVSLGKNF